MEIGDRFPDFRLPDADGNILDSADLEGVTYILYFYPRDNTSGCTKEALGFNEVFERLAARKVRIIGVSKDSPGSHRKFADKYDLKFTLLSDQDLQLIKAAGAWGKKMMYGRETEGTVRSTYIVGPDGTVKAAWPKVRVEGHAAQVCSEAERLTE